VWKETTKQERNLKIYNEEIRDFVPDAVLDFHVHVFNEETIPAGEPGFELPGATIRSYTIPELFEDFGEIFPGKTCSAVVFGFPDAKCSSDVNNRYVARESDRKRSFPFRLIRPEERPETVEEELREMGFFGVKPYLNYVTGKKPDDIEVEDMLPGKLMEVVDRLGLIVMLHVPRRERLADPLNQRQIAKLAKAFPNAKFVLAHVGRAYYLRNIVGHLETVTPLRNVFFDVSMLNNWEVLEYLFSRCDGKKIIYGTDIPIAVCGGKSVEINDQYTYVTSKPWHLSISDDHGKLVFTSFIYEQIRAIKKAVGRLKLRERFLEDLFHKNGEHLLRSAGARPA
jgi:hypothetical protein